jgi:hypothetical protein
MTEGRKRLTDDRDHTRETHYRWYDSTLPRNRPNDSLDYKESWIDEQCFKCCYFIQLAGDLGYNWGACTNANSPLDGKLMFEHDGCDAFSPAAEEDW